MPEPYSRGLVVLFEEPISPKVNLLLSKHEMTPGNHSQSMQLQKEELTDKTLILTMTFPEKVQFLETYGDGYAVYTLGEFAGVETDVRSVRSGKRKHMKNALKRLRRESDLQYTDWRRKKKMIALGSDHGGYSLKQEVKAYLEGKGIVDAVEQVVKANAAWVPPFGSGATLYIRPYMIATNAVIGVKPADEYQFRILVTPVGPYFKGGAKPITIRVSDFDRAACRSR